MCPPLNPHSSSSATQGLNTSIMRFLRRVIKRVIKHNLVALVVKNPTASAGDVGSVPRSGRCPGGGHGNPLRYSCLENPVDRGTSQSRKSSNMTEATLHAHKGQPLHPEPVK